MQDSWFFDANFNDVPDDNFFDDVFKYCDFPLENVESNDVEEDWNANLKALEPPPADVLAGFSNSFSGRLSNDLKPPTIHSGLSDETSKLRPCSSTDKVLPSSSSFIRQSSTYGKDSRLFQTSSPVSVLESSSSCSAENSSEIRPKLVGSVKRARSKRLRPSVFNPQRFLPFIASRFSASRVSYYPVAGSESVSDNIGKQKKKRSFTLHSSFLEVGNLYSRHPARKCTHCEATKTPQWREGPMGPKTLCNACGVRYRSGRLLPEYRPAASPTFVPSVHSNSHRKVVEMRKKSGSNMAGMGALVSARTPQYLFG